MAVKQQISATDGTYFITITCINWLHLFEISNSYNCVYKWFNVLKESGHSAVVGVRAGGLAAEQSPTTFVVMILLVKHPPLSLAQRQQRSKTEHPQRLKHKCVIKERTNNFFGIFAKTFQI